jgi:Utp14 protein
VEDVIDRQNRLAKMRSLLFRHEMKAKRIKQIKSKTYHKIMKKERQKVTSAELEMNPEAAKQSAIKQELKRAEVISLSIHCSFLSVVRDENVIKDAGGCKISGYPHNRLCSPILVWTIVGYLELHLLHSLLTKLLEFGLPSKSPVLELECC